MSEVPLSVQRRVRGAEPSCGTSEVACVDVVVVLCAQSERQLGVLSESPNSVLITLRPYMPLEPRYPHADSYSHAHHMLHLPPFTPRACTRSEYCSASAGVPRS